MVRSSSARKIIAGFSLPELIVTIAIISIITGLILLRYASFNSTVLLTSQAFEVALDLREAQVFGLSVRAEGSADFREEYGVYFDTSSAASRSQYVFFQDDDSNNGGTPQNPVRFDSGEGLNTLALDPRFEISRLCRDSNCNTTLSNVTISFKRPNFDAKFYSTSGTGISELYIEVSPIDGSSSRLVLITSTGQIAALE